LFHSIQEEVNPTKQTITKSTVDMLQKIEAIEKEVMDLKVYVLKKLAPTGKKVVSLKGILKGIEITDEDINSAKRSLYGKPR
jgi:Zn-dependent metalloprotease